MSEKCANCGDPLNYQYYNVCRITGKLTTVLYQCCSMKCLREKMMSKRRNKK